MADTSKVVAQFLGDESFPVEWESEKEKDLFWVYDDLEAATAKAEKTGKPLLVTFRCVP